MRRMKSMTGYGRGECAQDGFKITVELSAVNRQQSEISVNLPRELEMLEAPIRDAINRARRARPRQRRASRSTPPTASLSARMHINAAAGQGLRHRTGAAGQDS